VIGASLSQRLFDKLLDMPSFEAKVTEIRESPKGGYVVVLRPNFLVSDIAYSSIRIEPFFECTVGAMQTDYLELNGRELPPVQVGQTVKIHAVKPVA
jgi:hypothetical protein